MYFWHAWPRSDANCVREPDHWVSSEMTYAPYCAMSYSWIYPWIWIRILILDWESCDQGLGNRDYVLARSHMILCKTQIFDSSFCRPFLSLIISFWVSQLLLLNHIRNTCSLNSACSLNLVCLIEVNKRPNALAGISKLPALGGGILVGIFGSVPFGRNSVLIIWQELIARVSA